MWGGTAKLELLDSLTVTPPLAATPSRLMVPSSVAPPVIARDFTVTDVSAAGSTCTEYVIETDPHIAETLADFGTEVGAVPTVKKAKF